MVTTSKQEEQYNDAFQEHDSATKEKSRFLGLVEKRYLRTLHGAVHGLASTISLLLSNYLFGRHVILGIRRDADDAAKLAFFLSTLLSASVTGLFFWNKVQSWQLSTTTMKEKGLVAKQMKQFNQGRGVLALISAVAFPTLVHVSNGSEWLLESRMISTSFALASLALSYATYQLIRDYRKVLFLVYGSISSVVGTLILLHGGSIASLQRAFPAFVPHVEGFAYFVVSCVQFGFLRYYLYSRRLVSKEAVQRHCRNYHPILYFLYLIRILRDYFVLGDDNGGRLPWIAIVHVHVPITLLGMVLAVKMIKTQFKSSKVEAVSLPPAAAPANEEPRRQSKRRSSFFEAEGLVQARRQSSILEVVAR